MRTNFSRILVVSDNSALCEVFFSICERKNISLEIFDVAHSENNSIFNPLLPDSVSVFTVNVKNDWQELSKKYDLILSMHCKQLFPPELVGKVKCINLHPGLNPYNRGWYPQVFSIINKMPLGATLHEMDEEMDHGAIIEQKEISIDSWDTSHSAYLKVQKAEIEILEGQLIRILQNDYSKKKMRSEGNINLKKDFEALCRLDLNEKLTLGQAIDKLRALTHGDFKNAWFNDPKTGKKIFVKIELEAQ
jgi:dTDP-4-amino-4,6-dideoxyglucose formyltransferase